jgi:hypothetical protein
VQNPKGTRRLKPSTTRLSRQSHDILQGCVPCFTGAVD